MPRILPIAAAIVAGPYADARGHLMRAGVASVQAVPPFRDWDEIRALTVGEFDGSDRILTVAGVEEIGALPAGLTAFNTEAPTKA
jgi:hypothetical protein